MKCQECVNTGQKSQVYPGPASVTCMGYQPYYDEEGVYHDHDPNWRSRNYTCSKGHDWVDSYQAKCPAEGCDYGTVR